MPEAPIPTFADAPRPQSNEMFVDAFARGLQVIRSFSEESEKQTLSDVARRSGISRASSRRLLHTLVQLGYVDYDGKHFALKPKILDLGYSYMSSLDLAKVAKDAMKELATTMGSSCSLGILDGHDIVSVRRTEVRTVTTCRSTAGSRMPAHLLAMGRIQLAALGDEALQEYLSTVTLTRYTPYTITDPKQLESIIRTDGKNGWSLVKRERDEGICSIGMAVRGKDGKTAAGLGLSIRPDLSNDPVTLGLARRELAKAVHTIGDLLRMRS